MISLVVPANVRKHSEVNVHAFVRSYGLDGMRTEVELLSVDGNDAHVKKLDSVPLTLADGFQSVNLSFRSDETIHSLRASVSACPDEITVDNNASDADVIVERSKLRVLYVEGSLLGSRPEQRNGRIVTRGPFSELQDAIQEDPDVECRVIVPNDGRLTTPSGTGSAFPRSPVELSSFDAIVLSNISADMFTEEQLTWIRDWLEKRGGGLCMVGGENSFEGGGWQNSPLASLLPVMMSENAEWAPVRDFQILPNTGDPLHPMFRLLEDRRRNIELLSGFPRLRGAHRELVPRPHVSTVLAAGRDDEAQPLEKNATDQWLDAEPSGENPNEQPAAVFPAITAGRFGRGRTLAMAFPITGPGAESLLSWGSIGSEYYVRFWRNTVYWLTENSSIGRRRLAASVDKRFYKPGEKIVLTATAYDDAASATTDYRVVAMIEPQSLDVESDYAPIRWPSGVQRTSGEESPLVMWGEEVEIPASVGEEGRGIYSLDLELVEAQTIDQAHGALRLELTAYQRDTQLDSASLPLQVVHDPFEQQNPFPNHELLHQLAAGSRGSTIATKEKFEALLQQTPLTTGPHEVRRSPAWSRWWCLIGLMGILTIEWCWRRYVGLA